MPWRICWRQLVRVLGVNHLIVGFQWPGMPQSQVLDAMQLFAEEVMPGVREGV